MKFERSILKSASEFILPGSEKLPVSANQIRDFDEKVEETLEDFPPFVSFLFRFILILIQLLPLLFFIPPFRKGIPTIFTRLPREDRIQYLRKLNESSFYLFRMMMVFLKLPLILTYCASKEVKNAIGYYVDCKNVEKNPTPELVEENVLELDRLRNEPFEINCDVLVIGSGAGGAVMAKELSESGLNVAVVEEGFKHESSEFTGEPREMLPLLYRDMGTTMTFYPASISQPGVLLPLGECLGGTTVINSSTCFRTPDFLLENWTNDGLEDMRPEDMVPYFERVEKTLSVRPVSLNLMGEANARIMEGTESLGYDGGPLKKNATGCDATGVCQYGCPTDAKQAMHISYIPLATQKGAKFYTGFKAKWIVTKNGRVDKVGGIVFRRGKEKIGKFVAEADVVVLAAGAIHTPCLLLENRIANSSGMVGRNLRIHPAGSVISVFPESIYGWKGVSQSYGVTEFFDEGILLEGGMIPPSIGAAAHPSIGRELCDLLGDWKKTSVFGSMIADSDSVGRVWNLPGWMPIMGGKPFISYRVGEQDKNRMVKSLAEISRIALAAGAEKVYPGIAQGGWITSQREVEEILNSADRISPSQITWSAYHPQGTCRMSVDPSDGVIDSYCRTHEIDNLFVSDASIFPECVHVNPQISIMAFANRCADYIAESYF